MSILLTLLVALASVTTHATLYEDGSEVYAIEWTAPECPDPLDEPCYIAFITDAETGGVRFVSGP